MHALVYTESEVTFPFADITNSPSFYRKPVLTTEQIFNVALYCPHKIVIVLPVMNAHYDFTPELWVDLEFAIKLLLVDNEIGESLCLWR